MVVAWVGPLYWTSGLGDTAAPFPAGGGFGPEGGPAFRADCLPRRLPALPSVRARPGGSPRAPALLKAPPGLAGGPFPRCFGQRADSPRGLSRRLWPEPPAHAERRAERSFTGTLCPLYGRARGTRTGPRGARNRGSGEHAAYGFRSVSEGAESGSTRPCSLQSWPNNIGQQWGAGRRSQRYMPARTPVRARPEERVRRAHRKRNPRFTAARCAETRPFLRLSYATLMATWRQRLGARLTVSRRRGSLRTAVNGMNGVNGLVLGWCCHGCVQRTGRHRGAANGGGEAALRRPTRGWTLWAPRSEYRSELPARASGSTPVRARAYGHTTSSGRTAAAEQVRQNSSGRTGAGTRLAWETSAGHRCARHEPQALTTGQAQDRHRTGAGAAPGKNRAEHRARQQRRGGDAVVGGLEQRRRKRRTAGGT
jgi:hypothetical protein